MPQYNFSCPLKPLISLETVLDVLLPLPQDIFFKKNSLNQNCLKIYLKPSLNQQKKQPSESQTKTYVKINLLPVISKTTEI